MLARFFSSKTVSSITKKLPVQITTQQLCAKLGMTSMSGPMKIDHIPNFYKVYREIRPATKNEIIGNGKKLEEAPKKGW